MLKRLTAITFLFILAFNAAGYFIVFKIKQQQIKKEVKQKIKDSLPEEKLAVLSFNISSSDYADIEWIEDHEFIYKGAMYDIVRRSANDNIVTYYCINDVQEEELFADLDRHINDQEKRSDNEDENNSLKLFTGYLPEADLSVYQSTSSASYPFVSFLINKTTISIPTPPPDKA